MSVRFESVQRVAFSLVASLVLTAILYSTAASLGPIA